MWLLCVQAMVQPAPELLGQQVRLDQLQRVQPMREQLVERVDEAQEGDKGRGIEVEESR